MSLHQALNHVNLRHLRIKLSAQLLNNQASKIKENLFQSFLLIQIRLLLTQTITNKQYLNLVRVLIDL